MQVKLKTATAVLFKTTFIVRTDVIKTGKAFYSQLHVWKNPSFVQSTIGALLVIPIVLAFEQQNALIVASLGSTVFVVLGTPSSKSARAKNVLSGHSIGLIIGSVATLVPVAIISALIAVSVTMLLMVLTKTAHAPATGTALGLSVTTPSVNLVIAFLIVLLIIVTIHHLGKPYLRDLV